MKKARRDWLNVVAGPQWPATKATSYSLLTSDPVALEIDQARDLIFGLSRREVAVRDTVQRIRYVGLIIDDDDVDDDVDVEDEVEVEDEDEVEDRVNSRVWMVLQRS